MRLMERADEKVINPACTMKKSYVVHQGATIVALDFGALF